MRLQTSLTSLTQIIINACTLLTNFRMAFDHELTFLCRLLCIHSVVCLNVHLIFSKCLSTAGALNWPCCRQGLMESTIQIFLTRHPAEFPVVSTACPLLPLLKQEKAAKKREKNRERFPSKCSSKKTTFFSFPLPF